MFERLNALNHPLGEPAGMYLSLRLNARWPLPLHRVGSLLAVPAAAIRFKDVLFVLPGQPIFSDRQPRLLKGVYLV